MDAHLSDLVARLVAAEGANYALEVDIFKFFNPEYRDYVEGRGGLVHRNDGEDQRVLSNVRPPNVTASIDAAVSLAERVLPGWGWGITHGSEKAEDVQGNVFPKVIPMPAFLDTYGYHRVPAIALVLATLRALQQKGSSNG